MTELVLICPCGHRMAIRAEFLGKVGRCPRCGREVQATPENTEPAGAVDAAPEIDLNPKPAATPGRLRCIDQLRGYAIAGMILVNYLSEFPWVPGVFHHSKRYFTYADSIAPMFVFVVGMGFRISMQRRAAKSGGANAAWELAKRYVILFCIAVVLYGPNFRIDLWDALTHIALAGLLCLPVMLAGALARLLAALAYLGLFTFLYLGTGYAVWMEANSMNGGPLSPLAFAFVLLAGTIIYDLLATQDRGRIFREGIIAILVLIMAAWFAWKLLPSDPGGVYAPYGLYWSTAMRWALPPFVFISTATSIAAFLFFCWLNDVAGREIPTLTILGMNPLVIYLLQAVLLAIHGTYLPEGVGPLLGSLGFMAFYLICYSVARRLWNSKIIIKL
ncbi:MAG: DUF1624 domain-containing protein [Candidatus Hydrogenedentes bacterium]|nr:DUF1624 domain-containing protein [Candidatus Hydrogenedentota bacterium]